MYNVRVIKTKTNASTGLRTVNVRAEQTNGNEILLGPEKSYLIDADTLNAHWGGKVSNWLAWVKMEHQRYHGIHESMGAELKEYEGKLL